MSRQVSHDDSTDVYRTIAAPSEGLFKDRGSRFIAKAYPVETTEEIKGILDSLRKEYHDARHHCYAWRLGPGSDHYRTNDDGEPANSAGKPIYGQMLSHDLTNILIVVIRYFGGTLLGVGGLINAYRSAAQDAINKAVIIEKTYTGIIRVSFPYPVMNDVMRLIKEMEAVIVRQEFSTGAFLEISAGKSRIEHIIKRLNQIDSVEATES